MSRQAQALTVDDARDPLMGTGLVASPVEPATYRPLGRDAIDRLDTTVMFGVNQIGHLQNCWCQETLTRAMLRDSTMRRGLDTVLNPRSHWGENPLRDLKEFFTLDIARHGKDDVKEVARVLDGCGAEFEPCCSELGAAQAPGVEAPGGSLASATDDSAKVSGTNLQWMVIKRDSSVDRYGVATDNEWLTAHYVQADGRALEWRYGRLSIRTVTELRRGETLGGEITFPPGRWLRKLDAAVYGVRGDVQWEVGALFSLVKNHLDVQIQRNVFAWAQALWDTEMGVAGNVPIGAAKLNFDYQHYKISDGNTVHDASLRIDVGKLLSVQRPLRLQLGAHRRWAMFNSRYYWSPTAPNETLGVDAGVGWEHPQWQFSTSIQRNLGLNGFTEPTWGSNTSASFRITRTISIGASYGSSSGAPRPNAYWRQYATVYLKIHAQDEK